MDLKLQIDQKIRAYLSGKMDVASFEEWFVPATWHVDPERDPKLGPLVASVTASLIDFIDGEISEAELRDQLSQAESLSTDVRL